MDEVSLKLQFQHQLRHPILIYMLSTHFFWNKATVQIHPSHANTQQEPAVMLSSGPATSHHHHRRGSSGRPPPTPEALLPPLTQLLVCV